MLDQHTRRTPYTEPSHAASENGRLPSELHLRAMLLWLGVPHAAGAPSPKCPTFSLTFLALHDARTSRPET